MNLSVGIVGLPNVGKSTLFNALLKKQQALAANYPFATIEPNIGIVPVPDERLEKLADIVVSEGSEILKPASTQRGEQVQDDNKKRPPIKPATVEFVDIAGLVKGAAEGAGLGNKFLSHIREVQIIAHVVRAFTDPNVIRHQDSIDPRPPSPEGVVDGGQAENDYATIQTELMLADIQSMEKSKIKNKSEKKPASPAGRQSKDQKVLERIAQALNTGSPVRDLRLTQEEQEEIRQHFLLTAKKEIVVLNVSEDEYSLMNVSMLIDKYSNMLQLPKDRFVVICAKIEAELAELSEEEQKLYLQDLGFPTSGLERLIQKAYETLGYISFLTAGEKEVRAWTIREGSSAVEASGEIHTDFMNKFIKAEVVRFSDFVEQGGWKASREHGKALFEGRDYLMQDGDVVEFKIGS